MSAMQLFRKLRCWLTGHDLTVHQVFTTWSRRIVCDRCGGDWGQHDEHGVILWCREAEEMYERFGKQIRPRSKEQVIVDE